MPLHPVLRSVTERITARSLPTRLAYLDKVSHAAEKGPRRAHLSCAGLAHTAAAAGADQQALAFGRAPNLGIVTAYNDMLSAHKPYETYPQLLRETARLAGGTAQVAGGVPAMCDGITQGESGMEISLFSRDVIALAASVALAHDTFDAAVFLGVCDKIVPGLVMAAARFGHLPAVFLPAGPMSSGIANDEKAKLRQRFASGDVSREELMKAEMAAYHGPGTCTFYGTANSNQMLMEFIGLHLPGASFVPPESDLRRALTVAGARRALEMTALGNSYTPVADILSEKAFVNAIVGLMATGGSTNLLLHLPAMARAAGVVLAVEDFAEISAITPLLARIYPNGLADVNHFHAAGGLAFVIRELLEAGLLHQDTITVAGTGLAAYTKEPGLREGRLTWQAAPEQTLNDAIVRPANTPFQPTGGLRHLSGNLGGAVMKTSAVTPERRIIEAPARIFHSQQAVKAAFQAGEFTEDVIIVVRFQGPRACGMPELHGLTPVLSVLQDRGLKVALLTDGRMSGASGKVPAAIHLCPEAAAGGAVAKLQDGDMLRIDAEHGQIEAIGVDLASRQAASPPQPEDQAGCGRELFQLFRDNAGAAEDGAAVVL